jgi:putative heme iron utilization protein
LAERFSPQNARELLLKQRFASLSTLMADASPYGSLVGYCIAESVAPVLLISDLAWHTRHLEADPRGSLLIVDEAAPVPLAGARMTVLGVFQRVEAYLVRDSYLKRHPDAAIYADFTDFSFWQMEPWQVHAIAGFGRIETFVGSELLTPNAV